MIISAGLLKLNLKHVITYSVSLLKPFYPTWLKNHKIKKPLGSPGVTQSECWCVECMISDSSWRQHSVHTCSKLVRPSLKTIHCYSCPPLHVCVSQWGVQYMFWLTVRDASWEGSAMKTWTMNHHTPQEKKNTPAAAPFTSSFLPVVVFPLFLSSPLSFCASLLIWPGLIQRDRDVFGHLWRWERRASTITTAAASNCVSPCD